MGTYSCSKNTKKKKTWKEGNTKHPEDTHCLQERRWESKWSVINMDNNIVLQWHNLINISSMATILQYINVSK